jgi:hypothetical protein
MRTFKALTGTKSPPAIFGAMFQKRHRNYIPQWHDFLLYQGTDHINTAVHQVNEISRKNRDAISVLLSDVSKFKIE